MRREHISRERYTQTNQPSYGKHQEECFLLDHRNLVKIGVYQIKEGAIKMKLKDKLNEKKSVKVVILACMIFCLFVVSTFAQDPQDSTQGVTPEGMKKGAVLSGFDSINPYSRKLNFSLPLLDVGGRGELKHQILLSRDASSDWTFIPVWSDVSQSYSYNVGEGPNLSVQYTAGSMTMRVSGDHPYQPGSNNSCPYDYYQKTIKYFTFTFPGGTEKNFYDAQTNGTPQIYVCNQAKPTRGTVFYSADGDGAMFVSDTAQTDENNGPRKETYGVNGYLKFKNGIVYRIDNGNVTWERDRNGNKMTFNSQAPFTITDNLSRQISITDCANSQPCTDIIYKGSSGATRTIRINYTNLSNSLRSGYSIQSIYSLLGGGPWYNGNDAVNPKVVSSVQLQDGRSYQFKYNNYGELARVELPTGGAVEYDYVGGVDSLTSAGSTVLSYIVNRTVSERRLYSDGATLTNKVIYTENSSPNYVIEEHRDGNNSLLYKVKHNYLGISASQNTLNTGEVFHNPWQDGLESQTDIISNDGSTVLQRTVITWQPRYTRSWGGEAPQISETESITEPTGANLHAKTTFSYDQYGNVTDTYQYDFGAGSPGALLRRSHNDYVTSTNYTSYSGPNLRSLPSQSWISSDAAGNNKASITEYEYDNYDTDSRHAPLVSRSNVSGHDTTNYSASYVIRGNLTKIGSYSNAASQTGAVASSTQYDILGNPVKIVDANGNASTISYTDNFGTADAEARTNSAPTQLSGQQTFAVPTSSTNPAGFTTYAQFDYFTGAAVDAEDINGTVSSRFYNDLLDRLTQTIIANNISSFRQQTAIAYDDINHKVTVTSDLNTFGDNSVKAESFYDGLGRTTESRKYEAGGGYVTTLTEYDALSRVKRVTNPYRPLLSEPQLWTTSVYDALGRITSITTPDNAVVQTAYSGNVLTATDQAGKQQRSITNGLGQLTRVDEPDAAGNLGTVASPNQPTNYFYDTLGKMVKVTQGVQNRFFKYDALGRLLRVRQPEQGVNAGLASTDTVTSNNDWSAGFTYDANGNMLTATDTKGTVITSNYDNLNRPLTRTYSDNTPTVTYTYDDPSVQFSKGRLTKTSNSVSVSQILSLDNLGRTLSSSQTTDGQNYDSAYTYNLSGALVEETYPSGRKVKNSFQSDGNLSKIETTPSGGIYATRADNFAYSPTGAISQLKIGSGKWETAQFNNRLQVTQLGLGTSATDTSLWKLNYDFGTTDNNGNVKSQTITVPSINPLVQTYSYDSVNRLKSVEEIQNNTQTFKQAFTYDRYGNRNFDTANTTTLGTCPTNQCNPAFDVNTNRITSSGYTYDLAGNIIADAQGRQFTFNGDNKQTQVKDSSNNIIGTYSYDGEGKRIKKVTNSETTTFVYSGGKLVAEYTLTTATPQAATTQYITTDILGSPRVISDGNGNIISRRDFMPFGEELSNVGGRNTSAGYSTDSIRQKFTGYQRDNETNLDFAEARYYNDQNGRFTAVDPLLASGKSANPQTFNRYAYVSNNPLILTDSTGMQAGTTDGTREHDPNLNIGCLGLPGCNESPNFVMATVQAIPDSPSTTEASPVMMGTAVAPLPMTTLLGTGAGTGAVAAAGGLGLAATADFAGIATWIEWAQRTDAANGNSNQMDIVNSWASGGGYLIGKGLLESRLRENENAPAIPTTITADPPQNESSGGFIRVTTPGMPAFQLRSGEEGISVFLRNGVSPALTDTEVLANFRPGSVIVEVSPTQIAAQGLIAVPTPGAPTLPPRLQVSHYEIQPGENMTRNQFKNALKGLN